MHTLEFRLLSSNVDLDIFRSFSFTELGEEVALFRFTFDHLLHGFRKAVAFFSGSTGIFTGLSQYLSLGIKPLHNMRVPRHETNNIGMGLDTTDFRFKEGLISLPDTFNGILVTKN